MACSSYTVYKVFCLCKYHVILCLEVFLRVVLIFWYHLLGFIYIRAKANAKAIFFDLCRCWCRCSINTQIQCNRLEATSL